MGELFEVKQATLSEHINNIISSGELDETSIGFPIKVPEDENLRLVAITLMIAESRPEKLDKIPDILKDDGYPDVQAFMKTYRKAEAIVTQYNQDLAEWEQTVKNGQKPAEKQHRPPERQSVRNRLRQLQEEGKQNSQPKQRKKSQDRDR